MLYEVGKGSESIKHLYRDIFFTLVSVFTGTTLYAFIDFIKEQRQEKIGKNENGEKINNDCCVKDERTSSFPERESENQENYVKNIHKDNCK